MDKIPLKTFALGLLWAGVCGMAPVVVVIQHWITTWTDPIDWNLVGKIGATGAFLGVSGFWRKNKALLQLPPWAEAVVALQSVKTVTTVEKTEKIPEGKVVTTVEETKVEGPPKNNP